MKLFPWALYALSNVFVWLLALTLGFAFDSEKLSFGDVLLIIVSAAIPIAMSVSSADYLLRWKFGKLPHADTYSSSLFLAFVIVLSILGIVGIVYVSRNILFPASDGSLWLLLVVELSAILLTAVIAVIHLLLIWLDRIGRIKSP